MMAFPLTAAAGETEQRKFPRMNQSPGFFATDDTE
jgi:hypothetical protein